MAWYRRQDAGIKAAVIGAFGTLCGALLGAVVTLAVALIAVLDGGGTSNLASPSPDPSSSAPAAPVPPDATSEPPSSPSATDSAPNPTEEESTPAVPPTSPPPADTSPPPASDPAEPPPLPAPTSRVRWHGSLALDGSAGVRGWRLDASPPARAPMGDLAIRGSAEVYAPFGITRWGTAALPDHGQCAESLNTQLGRQALSVQEGDVGCFVTEYERVGAFRVRAVRGAEAIDVEVVVWDVG